MQKLRQLGGLSPQDQATQVTPHARAHPPPAAPPHPTDQTRPRESGHGRRPPRSPRSPAPRRGWPSGGFQVHVPTETPSPATEGNHAVLPPPVTNSLPASGRARLRPRPNLQRPPAAPSSCDTGHRDRTDSEAPEPPPTRGLRQTRTRRKRRGGRRDQACAEGPPAEPGLPFPPVCAASLRDWRRGSRA